MKATDRLRELGQSLWLDNITRQMLQQEGVEAFAASWRDLISRIAAKSASLAGASTAQTDR